MKEVCNKQTVSNPYLDVSVCCVHAVPSWGYLLVKCPLCVPPSRGLILGFHSLVIIVTVGVFWGPAPHLLFLIYCSSILDWPWWGRLLQLLALWKAQHQVGNAVSGMC